MKRFLHPDFKGLLSSKEKFKLYIKFFKQCAYLREGEYIDEVCPPEAVEKIKNFALGRMDMRSSVRRHHLP